MADVYITAMSKLWGGNQINVESLDFAVDGWFYLTGFESVIQNENPKRNIASISIALLLSFLLLFAHPASAAPCESFDEKSSEVIAYVGAFVRPPTIVVASKPFDCLMHYATDKNHDFFSEVVKEVSNDKYKIEALSTFGDFVMLRRDVLNNPVERRDYILAHEFAHVFIAQRLFPGIKEFNALTRSQKDLIDSFNAPYELKKSYETPANWLAMEETFADLFATQAILDLASNPQETLAFAEAHLRDKETLLSYNKAVSALKALNLSNLSDFVNNLDKILMIAMKYPQFPDDEF